MPRTRLEERFSRLLSNLTVSPNLLPTMDQNIGNVPLRKPSPKDRFRCPYPVLDRVCEWEKCPSDFGVRKLIRDFGPM